ncbi:hypothetical protein MRS44_018301 [Fusarium solani]|uniref:uncharacterized protein n=1 Tax=Fusarium solani TaxID=169388 RepID=UPI0032C4248B|nr:hypothetical protein MRS44_018301 [Fusarium solani]
MESTGQEDSSRVILKGPGNWNLWINIIRKSATSHNIWEFIDPSKATKPALSKPKEPTFLDINPKAASLAALTADEFRRLEFLYSSYRTQCQTYRGQQKALASIQQHIVNTVGSYYGTIEDCDEVASELAVLRARIEPSDYDHEQRILERYYAVLKGPTRTKLETWITSWRKVLTEMNNLALPEAQGLRPTHRFLQAISSLNPSFADYWSHKIRDRARTLTKEQLEKEIPDGFEISELFEKEGNSRPTATKGSFASFQGTSDDHGSGATAGAGTTARPRKGRKPDCLC